MQNQPNNVEFTFCDFANSHHCDKLLELLNCYINDPMGGGIPLDQQKGLQLIAGLKAHPASFVLFVLLNNEIAGLATCFVNFSTFKASPYINIHDIIVKKEMRGSGLGKALLHKITSIATEKNYCKVTLEVREDNTNAKTLYQSLGFKDTEPPMHFWTKML
ncbi:MAG TPA: GNAT family N-acetyltransferase [Bacteroidales bacterium]|nr:GNAT family N-acetyltransferase [Bacteroidales bacterium]